jgi:hypothetical protein
MQRGVKRRVAFSRGFGSWLRLARSFYSALQLRPRPADCTLPRSHRHSRPHVQHDGTMQEIRTSTLFAEAGVANAIRS